MRALYGSFGVFSGVALIFFSSLVEGLNKNSMAGIGFSVSLPPSIYANISNITLIVNDASGNGYVNGDYMINPGNDVVFASNTPSAIVVLPGSAIPTLNETSSKGIRIGCAASCLVQMMINSTYLNAASEGTILPPQEANGHKYVINGVQSDSGSFSAVAQWNTVSITFPNGTRLNRSSDYFNGLSFSGSNLDGTLIESDDGVTQISTFVGRDGSNTTGTEPGSYLLEQLLSVDYFGTDFIFVNPSGLGSDVAYASLFFANGVNQTVSVTVSGLSSFSLDPYGTTTILTKNSTHFIHSSGPIDVQVVSGSYSSGNVTQFGLTPNTQFFSDSSFYVQPNSLSRLIFVAKTADIQNSNNYIRLNRVGVDLTSFMVAADPSYSFSIIVPRAGSNVMDSNIDLAGYLFDSSSGKNFGSSIGRALNISS